MTLDDLLKLHFDNSTEEDEELHVGCSQCDPVFINGHPCHESGCPNARKIGRDDEDDDFEDDFNPNAEYFDVDDDFEDDEEDEEIEEWGTTNHYGADE